MRNLLAGMLLAALPALASAQFCPSCIQNSAAVQSAQFNITSATIRGMLTVGQLNISTISASTVTAGVFIGSGTFLTNLNASQLLLGTVPSARLAGSYTGITAVGALTAGTWNGTAIGTQYGGTGQNFVNVGAGSIVYFSGTGAMATLSGGTPEALLQTNGAGAPVWTSSPAVSGLNIYGINPFQLAGGSLPTNVLVSSNSISYVNAASVYGAFGPQVSFSSFTGTILLSQLSTGTLPTSVVASSITGTGISKGIYGDSSHTLQISFGTDGRASTITVMNMSVPLNDLQSGTLASGILVPAANVQAGTLGGSVVASSIAATSVAPGTYGGPTQIPQFTVGQDGRLTAAANNAIAGIVAGTGSVGQDAIWSTTFSLTSGLLYEHLSQVNVSTNSGVFLYGATGNLVSQSSVTASAFFGNGAAVTSLTAANLTGTVATTNGGTGQNWVNVSSGALPYFSFAGVMTTLPAGATGQTLVMSGGYPSWANASSSATNLSGGAAGSLPYQSAPNVTTFLAASTNGKALQLAAGVPSWVAAVSSATNLAGGAVGAVPYQSAANTTALLAAGTQNYVLQANGAGAPSWVAAASSATNVVGGAANSLPYQTAANTTAMLAQGTGVLQELAGVPTWTQAPILTTFVSTGTSNSVSTMTITQDSAVAVAIPNTPIYAVGSPNADWQLAVQNKSNGNNANAGFYALADNGTNTSNGAWFGINGSGYSQSGTWFDGPDDGIAYALSGNMGLGAAASGKIVSIFAGGTLGANIVSVFTSTGMVINPSGFTVGYNVTKSTFVVAGGSATVAYQMTAGSFLTTGSAGYVTSSSSITTTGGGFFGSLRDTAIASGTQCLQADGSGNITGSGSSCASTTGFGALSSTQSWSGTNTFTNEVVLSSGIRGVTNAAAGCSGCVGEYISSQTAAATSFPASSTSGNLVQITLTPGDWDVWAGIQIPAGSGSTVVAVLAQIGQDPSDINDGNSNIPNYFEDIPQSLVTYPFTKSIQPIVFNISVSTIFYLKYFATYSVATPKAQGGIYARRRR